MYCCDKCLCFYCVHSDDDEDCKGGLCWLCWRNGEGKRVVKKCDKFEKEVDKPIKK